MPDLHRAADIDFLEQAQRAADEIPNSKFISTAGRNHYAAHTEQDDPVLEAVLRTSDRLPGEVNAHQFL